MAAFDDVRLPEDIEKGSEGGPQFFTSIVRLTSGGEARNQNWVNARCVFDISYGVNEDTTSIVVAFFYARRGRLRGFRFKDWSDFEAESQTPIGVVDGTNKDFQLAKAYDDGLVTYIRPITRPVADTLNVFVNGLPTTAYTLGAHGVVSFTNAPSAGSTVRCTFEFDVPVRFDNDTLSLSMETARAAAVSSINVVEIIE